MVQRDIVGPARRPLPGGGRYLPLRPGAARSLVGIRSRLGLRRGQDRQRRRDGADLRRLRPPARLVAASGGRRGTGGPRPGELPGYHPNGQAHSRHRRRRPGRACRDPGCGRGHRDPPRRSRGELVTPRAGRSARGLVRGPASRRAVVLRLRRVRPDRHPRGGGPRSGPHHSARHRARPAGRGNAVRARRLSRTRGTRCRGHRRDDHTARRGPLDRTPGRGGADARPCDRRDRLARRLACAHRRDRAHHARHGPDRRPASCPRRRAPDLSRPATRRTGDRVRGGRCRPRCRSALRDRVLLVRGAAVLRRREPVRAPSARDRPPVSARVPGDRSRGVSHAGGGTPDRLRASPVQASSSSGSPTALPGSLCSAPGPDATVPGQPYGVASRASPPQRGRVGPCLPSAR